MRALNLIASALVMAILTSQSALATICFTEPPPCFNHTIYDTIFTGTVKNIQSEVDFFPALIEFEVEEGFKGTSHRETMFTWHPHHSAQYTFRVGDHVLIYGDQWTRDNEDKSKFSTNICTRTRSIDNAAEDLKFLRDLNGNTPSYMIWGTISERGDRNEPVKAIRAEVRDGKEKRVGVSDDEGNIRIPVSKPGKYTVRVFWSKDRDAFYSSWIDQFPSMLPTYGKNRSLEITVDVKDRACGWFDVVLRKNQ